MKLTEAWGFWIGVAGQALQGGMDRIAIPGLPFALPERPVCPIRSESKSFLQMMCQKDFILGRTKDVSLGKARLLRLPVEDRPDHLQTTWQTRDKGLETLR